MTPVAGMFLWFKLNLPLKEGETEGDSFALISDKAKAKGVFGRARLWRLFRMVARRAM